MKTLLISLLKDVIIEGVPKLVNALVNWVSRKKKESEREKALKKYEESEDPKDLLDLEDHISDK